MRTVFTCLLFTILCFQIKAQPFIDIASVNYQKSPDAPLFGKGKNPFSTDNLLCAINLPVTIIKNDKLLINPAFEWTGLRFKQQDYMDVDLYSASLALSYVKQWKNEKWKTIFVSINRINSDFHKLTIKHYQPGGALLTTYERNPKIKYKLGVYYNAEFFGAYVLPLLGVDWKISDRLMLYGLFPRSIAFDYKITSSLYAGLNWKAITSSFRYLSDNTNDYFKIEENMVRIFFDYYITKHLVLNLEAGHTFLRTYSERSKIYRDAGLDSDLEVNEGLVFKAGMYYRIRFDEKK